ncbi:hypothetical protein Hanom_Chr04g00382861 [Helianthus anomalus]
MNRIIFEKVNTLVFCIFFDDFVVDSLENQSKFHSKSECASWSGVQLQFIRHVSMI